ncbi:hypothetical protein BDN70DRAFT_882700 [Pholiota conissans]|uniref:SMODS and SLOG-associating 2TM effector domain-containing protein n=1 Tax=Pholiota conissans TaxID=109636 RepID=A0A9P6CQT0_9AGAR|nr:hypothetical protein BDN70DRAFT_882700 [Pholiota conissans]
MSTEHATPSSRQDNQPASIHEGTPSDQAANSRPLTQEGDPFRTNSDSQEPQPNQPQESSAANITQPPQTYYPLSPTNLHRNGEAESLWRQDTLAQNRLSEPYRRSDLVDQPLPPLPGGVRLTDNGYTPRRQRTISIDPRVSGPPQSARPSQLNSRQALNERPDTFFDDKAGVVAGSIRSRLSKTIESATSERDKYASRARYTGLALNVAIGLQVLLGSLTTGLSAVATQGKNAAVATTILGALATLVASYLARARGSNEPELSITRVKDLEHFLRDCNNFSDDHGDYVGHDFDEQLEGFRQRFEELLGNANGERKLSPPGA